MKNLIVLVWITLTLFACQSGASENKTPDPSLDLASAAETVAEEVSQEVDLGEKVFKTYCLVCHQANGAGVPNLYPPLSDTDWVNGDKERLIDVVLNGLQGPIEIDGTTYNSIMVSHSHLKDEEIAAVLTYVRSNFGNDSSPITVEEVADVRASE
ncbi:MAG: c-type cytochrome [Cyclobacteriaceae bacterium]